MIFKLLIPPPSDFLNLPIQDVKDQQNISSFLHYAGWLDVVKMFTNLSHEEIIVIYLSNIEASTLLVSRTLLVSHNLIFDENRERNPIR